MAEVQNKPNSNNAARRSLSIFSRKGYDASSPVSAQSLAFASIALATPSTPSATFVQSQSPTKSSSSCKKWKIKRNSTGQHQGTILRAVPKEVAPPALTALEIEMQTSPNDEILKKIGMSVELNPEPSSSPVEPIYFHQTPDTPMSSRRLSRKERRNSSNSVIGVWRDGSVAWEAKRNSSTCAQGSSSIDEVMDLTSLAGPLDAEGRSPKPKIQVVIPKSRSRRLSTPTYLPPISPTEEITIKELEVEEDSAHLRVPGHRRSNSGGSSSRDSVSSEEDKDSSAGRSSNRSSMTSINSDSSPEVQREQVKTLYDSINSRSSLVLETIEDEAESQDVPADDSQPLPSLLDLVDIVRTPSTRVAHRVNRAFSGSVQPMSTLREYEEESFISDNPSPTLSEAERNLEAHLSTLTQVQEWRTGSLKRTFSIPRKPAPPPKSAKRLSRNVSLPAVPSTAPRPRPRSSSESQVLPPPSPSRAAPAPPAELSPVSPASPSPPPVPPKQKLRRSSSVRSCLSLINEENDREIAAKDAEKVIYHILHNSMDFNDMFSLALMNRAFYRVFKNNELELMQQALKNMSPAAWEFKQTCLYYDDEEPDSAIPAPEYTAASYYSSYMRDCRVIANLKILIHERCQSIIRPTTEIHLLQNTPLRKSPIDDALWRIWTFTKLFGCGKGREDDIASQLDWLRGGVLAHETTAQSSFSSSDSWFATSALLGTSEHFAMGNANTLSAEELYDVLELWNCLRLISGGVVGKTEYARQYGVYDDTDVRGGDIDGEEIMLEEWHSYLLTLGLSVILHLSEAETSQEAFGLARRNQWTRWAAACPGKSSRANFLRESVSRLYEERINETFSPVQTRHNEMREVRRRRTSSLAVELKTRKADPNNEFPLVTVEVPISRANTVIEHLATPVSSQRDAFDLSSLRRNATQRMSIHSAPPDLVYDSPVFSPLEGYQHIPQSSLLPTPPSPPSPSHDPNPPMLQHPFQVLMQATDPSVNSSEKAIFRIMEMGFTSDEAKGALKITDMGDGLRVDRAVEYLLRQQGAH